MPDNFFTLLTWLFGTAIACFTLFAGWVKHRKTQLDETKIQSEEHIKVKQIDCDTILIKVREGILSASQIVQLFDRMAKLEKEIFEIRLSDDFNSEKMEDLKKSLEGITRTLEGFRLTYTQSLEERLTAFDLYKAKIA